MADPRQIIIAGNQFTIPQPFDEGHVCTAGEARALNQLLAENVRNNLAEKVKKGEVNQDGVTEYATAYEFSVASVPKPRLDPVEAEARKIAKNYIKGELAKVGSKIDDVDEDALEAEIQRVASMDEVVKMAKDIVKARNKATGLQLGSLGIEVPASTEEEAPA